MMSRCIGSRVIDHIAVKKDDHYLTYFYCIRNSAELERAEPAQIARSLMRQMSRLKSERRFFNVATEVYEQREQKSFADGPLRFEKSIELIIKLTSQYMITSIIIDALDECDPKTRYQLFEGLTSITKKSSKLMKIFISNRDDKDLVLNLQDLSNLYIKASHNADDIDKFVQTEVRRAIVDKRLLGGHISEGLKRDIIKILIEKAQGM